MFPRRNPLSSAGHVGGSGDRLSILNGHGDELSVLSSRPVKLQWVVPMPGSTRLLSCLKPVGVSGNRAAILENGRGLRMGL